MVARTALEIYFNPDDIDVSIGEEKGKEDIWGLVISRGPRLEQHPFKFLITSNETSNLTKEKALEAIETELRAVKKFGDELFTGTAHGLLKALMNVTEFKSKEEYVTKSAPVLEYLDIERIMIELRNEEGEDPHHSAPFRWSTWKKRYPKKESQ